jgi:hypothetical protein
MHFVTEPARNTPIAGEYDVVMPGDGAYLGRDAE